MRLQVSKQFVDHDKNPLGSTFPYTNQQPAVFISSNPITCVRLESTTRVKLGKIKIGYMWVLFLLIKCHWIFFFSLWLLPSLNFSITTSYSYFSFNEKVYKHLILPAVILNHISNKNLSISILIYCPLEGKRKQ